MKVVVAMDNDALTPQSKKKEGCLRISLQGHWKVVHISKDVIRVLGAPSHICLRVNEANDSIAISPCDPSEVLSFKTPEGLLEGRPVKFRIRSQQFVTGFLQANDLDVEKTYFLMGTYLEKTNAVIFRFDDITRDVN